MRRWHLLHCVFRLWQHLFWNCSRLHWHIVLRTDNHTEQQLIVYMYIAVSLVLSAGLSIHFRHVLVVADRGTFTDGATLRKDVVMLYLWKGV